MIGQPIRPQSIANTAFELTDLNATASYITAICPRWLLPVEVVA